MRQIKSGWVPALFMVLALFAAGCQNNMVDPPDGYDGNEPEASVVQDDAGGYFLQFRLSYANKRTINEDTARKVLRDIYEITVLDKGKYTPPVYIDRGDTYSVGMAAAFDITPAKYDGVPETRIVSGEELVTIPIEIGKTYKVLIIAGHKASRTLLGAWYGETGPVTAGINTVTMTGGYMPTPGVTIWTGAHVNLLGLFSLYFDPVTATGIFSELGNSSITISLPYGPLPNNPKVNSSGELVYELEMGRHRAYHILMNEWHLPPEDRYLNGPAHRALREAENASLIPRPELSGWPSHTPPPQSAPLYSLQSPFGIEFKYIPDSTATVMMPKMEFPICFVQVCPPLAVNVYTDSIISHWVNRSDLESVGGDPVSFIVEDIHTAWAYPPDWRAVNLNNSEPRPLDFPQPPSIMLTLEPHFSSSFDYSEGPPLDTEWDFVLYWYATYRPFGRADGGENWIIRRGINNNPEKAPTPGGGDSAGGGIRLKIKYKGDKWWPR